MMRVLIADDEAPARDKLSRWLREQPDIELIGQAGDGIAAARDIEELRPDAAFLDIQMPGCSGLEVASQLDQAQAPLLVFVTAFDEHAVRAFDLNAIDYLLKPYDKDRFIRCLARVRERFQDTRATATATAAAIATARSQTANTQRLLVPDSGKLELIESSSIDWLEAADNYVHVHTATRSYLLRRTLQDLLTQLGSTAFVRIHKSAAVNLSAVTALAPLFKGDYEVQLRSGRKVRLSRRYKDDLFARMPR
jgi:two-component system, LytTR family, response regulator